MIDLYNLCVKLLLVQEEGSSTEPIPSSSSKMINFEFSNGHPYVPSSSAEDHEYVEYPLQHVEGFPCNIEEEERVSFLSLSPAFYFYTHKYVHKLRVVMEIP